MAEYSGWKNYETFLVALWIDNEQCSYDQARQLTLQARGKADLARDLKYWIEDSIDSGGMMPDLGASLASDLLNSALSEVDWYEIAEHYLSELPDDDEEEDADEEEDEEGEP